MNLQLWINDKLEYEQRVITSQIKRVGDRMKKKYEKRLETETWFLCLKARSKMNLKIEA